MESTPQVDSNYRSTDQIHSFVNTIETVYMLDQPFISDTDRREAERMNVTMPVVITPLDEVFQKLDFLHHGITRDISCRGIGLVTTNPMRPGNSLLTLEPCHGEPFNVIARVTYCNEIGNYFQVGCEFLGT